MISVPILSKSSLNPNPARPFLYVVFNDDLTPGDVTDDNSNVYITRSINGGLTWIAPQPVASLANDQFFPAIAIDNSENIMVGYYDRELDTKNFNISRSARIGRLDINGVPQFAAPFQLSPVTTLALRQDPKVSQTFMGGYDRIDAGGGRMYSTWSDNRAGNAFHHTQPDVFFGSIELPPDSSDLALTMSSDRARMAVMAIADLTVTATANGGEARDAMVHLKLPPYLSFAGPESQCVSAVHDSVDCYLGDIAAGSSKTRTIRVRGRELSDVTAGAIVARATTSSSETLPANNTAVTTIDVTDGTSRVHVASVAGPRSIPDNATLEVGLYIATFGRLANIEASIRLNHTSNDNLDIYLVSPAGTRVELTTDNGGGLDNYGSGSNGCGSTQTSFIDQATTPISLGTAPYAAQFLPEQPLTAFVNESVNGTWILRITDDTATNTGILGCFRLAILYKP